MLKCVPFSNAWVTHDKLDLKAIYRRPHWVEDAYGELHRQTTPDGVTVWDITGGLNVKYHNKHLAKGFEYVTLADRTSLEAAAAAGTVEDWRQYIQDPRTGGPWHYRKYIEGQTIADSSLVTQLAADVAQFGWEAVETIRRRTDPHFRVPESMKAAPVQVETPTGIPDVPYQPPTSFELPASYVKRGRGRPRKDGAAA